jgi:hypothetical protein
MKRKNCKNLRVVQNVAKFASIFYLESLKKILLHIFKKRTRVF